MNPGDGTTNRRGWKHFRESERYKLEVMLKAGHGAAEIGRVLGRDRRTIEREIVRGTVIQRRENPYASRNPAVPDYLDRRTYLADAGQRAARERSANKGRGLKIGHDHALARHLEKRIGEDRYSPDAALGEIRARGMAFKVSLCTKTVYNMIARGDFLHLSNKDLPAKRKRGKRRHARVRRVALNNLSGRRIDERPETVNGRGELGHWEMDLVVGKGKACLLVMTERVSRTELLRKLKDKRQESVVAAMDDLERQYKGRFRERFRSITMDNGSEFLDTAGLERSCLYPGQKRTVCYYAHPYSAWERGSNENANKLIRRFIPKGTDIGKLAKSDIRRIEHWMNNYPRRILKYRTASQVYSATVA